MNAAINLFAEFATDTSAEEEGVWEPYAEGVEFLIARTNNKTYTRLITKAYEKNKRLLEAKGEASDAKSEEIMIDTLARSVLVGWKGNFTWKDGQVVGDYTVDKAKMLLAVKDFRRWVMTKAEDMDRFKVAAAEEASEK